MKPNKAGPVAPTRHALAGRSAQEASAGPNVRITNAQANNACQLSPHGQFDRNQDLFKRIISWLLSSDTGLSSEAICAVMVGVKPARGYRHPLDPADLGRCLRLLDKFPEFKERLGEMTNISPFWGALVEHWDELAALYYQELPTGKAPSCYRRMRELLDAVEADAP